MPSHRTAIPTPGQSSTGSLNVKACLSCVARSSASYRYTLTAARKFEAAFAKRASAWGRGYNRSWRELRAEHLAREPYCAACAERGIGRQTTMVDHIIAVRQRPEIRLDSDS